jgi:hypothetical protein
MNYNKNIIILSTLILTCPSILCYYYIIKLQKKINTYKEDLQKINISYTELYTNYNELLKLLNEQYDNKYNKKKNKNKIIK